MSVDIGHADSSRLVAIVTKKQIVEIWQIQRERTNFREREVDVPHEVRGRLVHGQHQRYRTYKRRLLRQEWGHFVIRRYQATQIQPWMSSLGLAMLIPGTLMAAGTANQFGHVPVGVLVTQFSLVTVGGLMALASGWQLLVRKLISARGAPLESLGVSSQALGFRQDVAASESVPSGYRRGRFKGSIEVELPIGEWEVVQEYMLDFDERQVQVEHGV
jgi:hypothetical protein